jgi:lantibiotic modifying enzyme
MGNKNTNSNKQWQPVLKGDASIRARQVIHEIATALERPPVTWIPREIEGLEPYRIARGATLAMGSAGIALFYAYLSQAADNGNHDSYADKADEFMSHACDALKTVPMLTGLYRGLSGIAWTMQHFQGFLYEDQSGDPESDPNVEIDRVLLDNGSAPEKFDLWEGCVGLGVYALERYPLPAAKKLLELSIDRLDQLAGRLDNGIAWFTRPGTMSMSKQFTFSDGFYDLGVAHGAAGVISFLSRAYALGISKDTTGKLLHGAVSWLLAQQWESGDGSLFPQFIVPQGNTPLGSATFGFCHGDLGVAAALVSAAGCSGETSWKTKAVETAHASIKYLDFASNSMDSYSSNPHLCHGTAGLGHLFNRVYQATGIEAFKEEACKWFRRTLDLREPGTGIAGYRKYGRNEDGEMSELYDPGFIQGAAGVGLALLAAVTDIEPGWDRVMLVSAPEAK